MIFNLAAESAFESNTTSGNVSLTRAQLQTLTDGVYDSGGVTVTGTDILVLDVDLGNRVGISDIRYYFDSAVASGTVVNEIAFYSKNYDTDSWTTLTTSIGAGYYTTTSGNFFPQYVRMTHTVVSDGTVREFEVNSNDDIVDYGSDGSWDYEQPMGLTPVGESSVVTVPVYNDSNKTVDGYVFIYDDEDDFDSAEMLRISDQSAGTYISITDGFEISDITTTRDIQWQEGSLSNVVVSNNRLQLGSGLTADSWTSGEYLGSEQPARGAMRWHPTDPSKSEWWYNDNYDASPGSMAVYSYETESITAIAALPTSFYYYTKIVYDPEGDRMYAFRRNASDSVYIYWFDCTDKGGSWNSLGSKTLTFVGNTMSGRSVPGVCFVPSGVIPGDGERSILAVMGGTGYGPTETGQLDNKSITYVYRLKLTDHSWSQFTSTSNGLDFTGYYNSGWEDNNVDLVLKTGNFDDYPTGTSGVLFMMGTLADGTGGYYYWWHYPIVDSAVNPGWSNQWYEVDHDTIDGVGGASPAPVASYYKFGNSGNVFWYDEPNDRVYFVYPGTDSVRTDYYYYLDLSDWSYHWEYAFNDFVYGGSEYFVCYEGKNYSSNGDPYMIVQRGQYGYIYFYTPETGQQYNDYGIYTSPIVKNIYPTYFRVYVDDEPTDTYIAASENVYDDTIEVRSSDESPKLVYDLTSSVYSVSSQDHIYRYSEGGYQEALWSDGTTGHPESQAFNHLGDETYYLYISYVDAGYDSWIAVYDKNFNLVNSSEYATYGSFSEAERPMKLCIDKYGGVFAYIYLNSGGNDRVRYFNNGLAAQWTRSLTDNAGASVTRNAMDLATDNESVWFIDAAANEVYRVTTANSIVATINDISVPRAVISNDVDGCFIIGTSPVNTVYEYDNDGVFVRSGTIDCQSVGRAFKDFYGGFWFIDNSDHAIRRYDSDFNLLVEVTADSPDWISADLSGCWYSSGTYNKVVHIDLSGNIIGSYSVNSGDIASIAYHPDYENGFVYPASSDVHWGTSGDVEWNEVSLRDHYIANKDYHQFRITLRTTDGDYTPKLKSVHLVEPIKLYNIPSQGTKNVYVKTVVPSGTRRTLRQPRLRTWFDMEE